MNSIYVIYGTTKFLIDYNLKKIVGNNDVEEYNLEEIKIEDVLSYAREIPMFADKKYVLCDNSIFLSTSKSKIDYDTDELIKYIDNPVKTTVLVLVVNSDKLDNRKKVNILLSKKAKLIECNEMNENDIVKYAKEIFDNNDREIDTDTIKYLISRLNNNVELLENEVNKLCLIDGKITKEDIDELVTENIDDNIFNFIDCIIKNDKNKMFRIYESEINNGLEPIQIITMLSQELRMIYQVRVLSEKGYLDKDIMNILDIYKIGRIKFLRAKGKNISNKKIIDEISKLADIDIRIKTGEIDKYIALEKYMLSI